MIELRRVFNDQFFGGNLLVKSDIVFFDDNFENAECFIAVKNKKGVVAYLYDKKSKQCKKI